MQSGTAKCNRVYCAREMLEACDDPLGAEGRMIGVKKRPELETGWMSIKFEL